MMKRLALILFLVFGCAGIAHTPMLMAEDCEPRPTCPSLTVRHPDMGALEFVGLADRLVRQTFPGWYTPGVKQEFKTDGPVRRYAAVKKNEDGTFTMSIYPPALDLCTVGDMALTLFHEYVHVKIWNGLLDSIEGQECRSAIHELHAYGMEINQSKIRGTLAGRRGAQWGYALNHLKASAYCSEDLYKDFPKPELK